MKCSGENVNYAEYFMQYHVSSTFHVLSRTLITFLTVWDTDFNVKNYIVFTLQATRLHCVHIARWRVTMFTLKLHIVQNGYNVYALHDCIVYTFPGDRLHCVHISRWQVTLCAHFQGIGYIVFTLPGDRLHCVHISRWQVTLCSHFQVTGYIVYTFPCDRLHSVHISPGQVTLCSVPISRWQVTMRTH